MSYKEVPFDYELAKKHPESIFTRSGKEAKQVTFFEVVNIDYPIRAVIEGDLRCFTKKGGFLVNETHPNDLVIRIPVEEVEVTVYCFAEYPAVAFTAEELVRFPKCVEQAERLVSEGKATKALIKMVKP